MRSLSVISVCCAFCASALVANLPAQSADTFVKQYVSAWNSKDVSRLRSLYHEKSRACVTSTDADFYNQVIALELQTPIPSNYTVSVQPVNQPNLRALATYMVLPVPPERELHIDYQQGNDVGSVVLYLVSENGRWLADYPCATPKEVKDFRDSTAARDKMKQIAAQIKEPLRSELIADLRQHNTSAAIDRYHQATGQTTQTSMAVMDALKLSLQ